MINRFSVPPLFQSTKKLVRTASGRINPDLVLFLGSLAASYSVESLGNKKNINIEDLDRAIEYILK